MRKKLKAASCRTMSGRMTQCCGVFIPLVHFMAKGVNAHIQFESDQQYQGVEINKEHQDEDGTDGPVKLIVIGKITDVEGKTCRKNDHQESGKDRPGIQQSPFLLHGRSIPVNK